MRINLDCPVEVWRLEMPTEEHAACDLILYNLRAKVVTSAEVNLTLLDAQGQELQRVSQRAYDLNALPCKTFSFSVPVEEGKGAAQAEVVFSRLWFDDNSIWRAERDAMREYPSNHLPVGRELNFLRASAGQTAVGYPVVGDGLWVCVCGRPNREGDSLCARCHRERDAVFSQFGREAMLKAAQQQEDDLRQKTREAQEKASQRQAEREKDYNVKKQQRGHRVTAIVICLVLVAALCVGWFVGMPYLRYRRAVSALEAGRYEEAITAFAAMPGYRDADAQAAEARVKQAEALLTGSTADVRRAVDDLTALEGNEQAQALLPDARYSLAEHLLADGQAAEAKELFTALADDRDVAEQLSACDYALAKQQMDAGEDEAALAAFLALADYSDSAEQVQALHARMGLAALTAGELDEAIGHLEAAGDAEDAALLLQQAHYLKGSAYFQDALYTEAGQEFLLAGDYENAQELANECLYGNAQTALEAGEWAEAAELFGQIADFRDAADKQLEAQWRNALTLQKDQEYQAALAALEQLPEDSTGPDGQTVSAVRSDILYQQALLAVDREELESAVALFAQIPGWRDADDRLAAAQLQRVNAMIEAQDLEGAVALLETLPETDETAALLQSTRYSLAERKLDFGDWQGAEALLENFDEEQQAELQMGIDYLRAGELASQGKLEEALALYISVGDYGDAAEQTKRLSYAMAQMTEDPLAAADWYERAGDYADARKQAENVYDELFGNVAESARFSYDAQDYENCVALLRDVDLESLPERYSGLKNIWLQSNYEIGCALMDDGQPFAALPYFRAAQELTSASRRLQSRVYQLLGVWEDADGVRYQFREDGTCTLNGEELCFWLNNYDLSTGPDPEHLEVTHRVSTLTEQRMVLRDMRGEKVVSSSLRRVSDDSAPLATVTDLPELEEVR